MKIRLTNSSEVETDDIVGVTSWDGTCRIQFRDGSARTVRRVQLTPEGRALLESLLERT